MRPCPTNSESPMRARANDRALPRRRERQIEGIAEAKAAAPVFGPRTVRAK